MPIISYLIAAVILGLILAVIEFFIVQMYQGISKYGISKWFRSIIVLIVLSFISLNLKEIENLFNFNFANIVIPLVFVLVSFLTLFFVTRIKYITKNTGKLSQSRSHIYLRILILSLILVSFGYFREYIINLCKSLLSGYC